MSVEWDRRSDRGCVPGAYAWSGYCVRRFDRDDNTAATGVGALRTGRSTDSTTGAVTRVDRRRGVVVSSDPETVRVRETRLRGADTTSSSVIALRGRGIHCV